jgi:cephalosporin hydroxylase
MKMTIDTEARTLRVDEGAASPLYSPEAFAALSDVWLKVGWAMRYSYGFSWLGRPVIQLPEDLVRMQEVLHRIRPDVVVETGVAHGGSLIFYASLFKAMDRGRVVGVDIEIRPPNRAAIEAHPLADRIALIEGDSAAPETVEKVRAMVRPGETVMVVLDSNHTRDHVARELEAYAALVSRDSYVVVTDGIMQDLTDVPGGQAGWREDNPQQAARDFLERHPEFVLDPPAPGFGESRVPTPLTYWPTAWLRRR